MFYKTEIGGWVFVNNLSLYNYLYFSVKDFRFREMKPIEQPLSSCWMYFGNFYRGKIQFIWKKKYLIIILVQTKSFKQNQILGQIEMQMHKLIVQKNLN